MNHLDLIRLTALMDIASGRPEIVVGLIDGPVLLDHPDLSGGDIREVPGKLAGACAQASSVACLHGTFVAGILCGKRGSVAPAICPDCTLLVRPIFAETMSGNGNSRSQHLEPMPSTTPDELAAALIETIDAGAHVINLSAAMAQLSSTGERELVGALNYASKRGVLIVAAAGNQGAVGSTVITRHPWVIPVVACDLQGRPISYSNLGNSIGRRGLSAPGDNITSLGADGKPLTFSGTSAAAPFVTGAIALLWSEFPKATGADMKVVITRSNGRRRNTVVPPLLDAWGAYQIIRSGLRR
ncbi:MAG TPA: S8 family serine peptidase [Thermodesulfobacteriota bacterium]|nr:S8 family serine peptidase [Thermodesulfobacteriota bacterium]